MEVAKCYTIGANPAQISNVFEGELGFGYAMIDDHQIVLDCQNGELNRFAELFDMYYQKIYSFIYFRTYHKETSEDLTSITFMKALEKIKTFDSSKSSFKTWLYQIARNTVIDNYRTRKQHYDLDSEGVWDIPSNDDVDILQDIDTSLNFEKVKKCMDVLSPEQRQVIIMRLWDELSYKEIAEVLGKTEAGCKMMFSRSMAKLHGATTSLGALFVILAICIQII